MSMQQMPKKIQGPRIILRKPEAGQDAEPLMACVHSGDTYAKLKKGGIFYPCSGRRETANLINSYNQNFAFYGFHYLICKEDEILGVISGEFNAEEESKTDVMYFLKDSVHGNGYMTEALGVLEKTFFECFQRPLFLNVFKDNKASYKTALRAGYRLLGQSASGDFYFEKTPADYAAQSAQKAVLHSWCPCPWLIAGRERG